MPLYEYQCDRCGRFERIQKYSDPLLTQCPTCSGPVQKLPSSPAIQFKGSGWYVTDYARKPTNGGKKTDSKEAAATSSKDSPSSNSAETSAQPTKPAASGS